MNKYKVTKKHEGYYSYLPVSVEADRVEVKDCIAVFFRDNIIIQIITEIDRVELKDEEYYRKVTEDFNKRCAQQKLYNDLMSGKLEEPAPAIIKEIKEEKEGFIKKYLDFWPK